MQKHVCFVNSAFNREDALIVYRQGKSLVEAGYRVSYLLRDGQPDEKRHGIEMISVGQPAESLKERLKSNNRIYKPFLKDFHADVYQISEPELLPLGMWLKKQGRKVVYNLRKQSPSEIDTLYL